MVATDQEITKEATTLDVAGPEDAKDQAEDTEICTEDVHAARSKVVATEIPEIADVSTYVVNIDEVLENVIHDINMAEVVGENQDNKDENTKHNNICVRRSTRAQKGSTLITSPFVVPKLKKRGPVRPKNCTLTDEEIIELRTFNKLPPSDIQVEGQEMKILDKRFFTLLLLKGGWLETQHMGEALHYIRQRIALNVENYKKVVVLDEYFHQKFISPTLVAQYEASSHVDNFIGHYFLGVFPTKFGKPWMYSTHIYTPFNLGNEHWVALEIDVESRVISVYDSTPHLNDEEDMKDALMPLAKGLPMLLARAKILYNPIDGAPFRVQRVQGLPVDNIGGCCGVFALKYIECLVFWGNLQDVDDNHSLAFRYQMEMDFRRQTWTWTWG